MANTRVFRAVQSRLAEAVKSTPPHALNAADLARFSRVLPGWLTEGATCRVPAPASPVPASLEPDHA